MKGGAAAVFDSSTAIEKPFSWESYLAVRPDYQQDNFYDLIWDYHAAKEGRWDLAVDIGSGPGNVAEVLAERIQHVLATDPFPVLQLAKQKLQHLGDRVSFHLSRSEEVEQLSPAGSVDMITVAECIPLLDQEKSFPVFAKLLRPGGTLAIWFYGGPIYEDPKITEMHRTLTARSFDQLFPTSDAMWETTNRTMKSWVDNIPFSEADWTSISRTKWNSDHPLNFDNETFERSNAQHISNIQPGESITEIHDQTFWSQKADFNWAETWIDAQVPRPKSWKTPEVLEMLDEFKKMMGGKSYNVSFPVVLVLATRK